MQSPEALPEEDKMLFLLMTAKKMYQLVKFLISLTYLQNRKENFNKKQVYR